MSIAGNKNIGDTFDDTFDGLDGLFPADEGYHPQVLIVDDEPYVLRAVSRLLRDVDAEVLTAQSGKQAVKVMASSNISVLVSDQFMPGMSGTELLEYTRQRHPDIVRVMLTGNNDLATAVEAINRGDVFRFVLKPWNNDELLTIIKMALEQHQLRVSHKRYQDYVHQQNDRLRLLNEELERRVSERTRALAESHEQIESLYADLRESFDATINVLLDFMQVGDHKIVDHCRRTATRAQMLARRMRLPEEAITPLVRAALLHWLGLIGASESLLTKPVDEFDAEEQSEWEYHPLLAQQVLMRVSALERTSEIILNYTRRYDDHSWREGVVFEDGSIVNAELVQQTRILFICSSFEYPKTVYDPMSSPEQRDESFFIQRGILELKRGNSTRFDPVIAREFIGMIEEQYAEHRREVRLQSVLELSEGMILSRPLETLQGIPIAPRDTAVTNELLRQFQLFNHTGGLGPIFVYS